MKARFIEVSSPYSDDPCYIAEDVIAIIARNKDRLDETVIVCEVGNSKVCVLSDSSPEEIMATMMGEE